MYLKFYKLTEGMLKGTSGYELPRFWHSKHEDFFSAEFVKLNVRKFSTL